MNFSSRRVDLPHGISLHIREGGEGAPTTLLLHGWSVTGAVWDPVLSRWPDGGGRVIVPDLRGAGWTRKPREGYSLDDDINDVVALIDTLGLSDIVLVGHSKGGAIAQRVALERPDAIRKLILVCPVPASGVAFDDATLAFLRSQCGHREGAIQLIGAMIKKEAPPHLFERLIDSIASVTLESQLGGFDAFRTANFADRIGAIKAPTLVIAGGAEEALSPTLMRDAVVSLIPGATLHVLPDIGHYPQIECADDFTTILYEAASKPGVTAAS